MGENVLTVLKDWGLLATVFFTTVVEIVPCKFNPIQWIGKHLFGDVKKDIEELNKKIDEVDLRSERRNAETRRVRILQFSREMRSGMKPTEEDYNQVLQDIGIYKAYCNKDDGFSNEVANQTIAFIEQKHQEYMSLQMSEHID